MNRKSPHRDYGPKTQNGQRYPVCPSRNSKTGIKGAGAESVLGNDARHQITCKEDTGKSQPMWLLFMGVPCKRIISLVVKITISKVAIRIKGRFLLRLSRIFQKSVVNYLGYQYSMYCKCHIITSLLIMYIIKKFHIYYISYSL